ncbi:MAG TPA: ArsR family transcriptional regulator [bacterium (Candidatus Stahlbacteria)]|nr:ArsR family transcriptional regulator [Candidatus Stahlbacteria bacterium]
MAKKKIPEVRYRASRVCRVLGNPTAYEMLHLLSKGRKTPEQLADMLGISIITTSQTLRSLRQLDLVRYEVKWRHREYWVKYDAVAKLMAILETFVRKVGVREI